MTIRCRWYRINLPRGSADLVEIVKKQELIQEDGTGFTQTIGPLGQSVYRFFWETKLVVTQLDEKGESIHQEIKTLDFTDFAIICIKNYTFIRIENSGRTAKHLLNTLESIIGLGFTCELVTFAKQKPITVFEKNETTKIIALRVSNVLLGNDLVSRMDFSSKSGIIPEKLNILTGLSYKPESVSYEIIHKGIRGFLHLSAGGTVKVSGLLAPRLINLLEQDLNILSGR